MGRLCTGQWTAVRTTDAAIHKGVAPRIHCAAAALMLPATFHATDVREAAQLGQHSCSAECGHAGRNREKDPRNGS